MITRPMRQILRKLTFISGLLLVTAVACAEPADPPALSATPIADLPPPVVTTVVVSDPLTYTVVPGDFLSEIAARFDVTVDELSEANGILDPALIEVGQFLTIPGQEVEVEVVVVGDLFAAVAPAERWEDLYPLPSLPPPPEPSPVEQLIDGVASWPWPVRQDMVTGFTIGAFALAALVGGFVLTKVQVGTRRWAVHAVPAGARGAFRGWGAAARLPRRSYFGTSRRTTETWRATAASRKAAGHRYRWVSAATSAGWKRTAAPRRRAVLGARSATTQAVARVRALIGSALDRAPDAADGLNTLGERASTSVRRGVTSGAKRARREVLEKSAPPERWTTPLAGDLAKAFERRQLQARYVPVIDLDIHALSAVEAHLFGQHPQRGLMTERDIYTATQDHPELGAALLEFLLEQSCSFLKEQVDHRFPSAQVIVPVTLEQIVESEPLAAIDRGLTTANLAIDRLKVAISEADALQDPLTAASFIRNLRSMGLGVYLDHYGVATAEDLTNLRVSSATVDFAAAGTSSEARERISAAVESAQEVRLPVTARHGRSEAAQSLAVEFGCAFAAVGAPIPADAFVTAHVVERREASSERRAEGPPAVHSAGTGEAAAAHTSGTAPLPEGAPAASPEAAPAASPEATPAAPHAPAASAASPEATPAAPHAPAASAASAEATPAAPQATPAAPHAPAASAASPEATPAAPHPPAVALASAAPPASPAPPEGDARVVEAAAPAAAVGPSSSSASDHRAEGRESDVDPETAVIVLGEPSVAAEPEPLLASNPPPALAADEPAASATEVPEDGAVDENAGDAANDEPPATAVDVAFAGTARARGDKPVLMNRPTIVRHEIQRAGAARRAADRAAQSAEAAADSAEVTGEEPEEPRRERG